MFASAAFGPTHPRITSPTSVGANGCRSNSGFAAATAKSAAGQALGLAPAFINGVRVPSIIYTSRPILMSH